MEIYVYRHQGAATLIVQLGDGPLPLPSSVAVEMMRVAIFAPADTPLTFRFEENNSAAKKRVAGRAARLYIDAMADAEFTVRRLSDEA